MQDLKIYSPDDFPEELEKLNALYEDLFASGKGFRSKMVSMLCAALQAPADTERLLCQTIEFIHNASLLHDDLIDRAPLRRGKTASWLKYSPEYAVLAGDYLLARVMVNLSRYGNLGLIQYTAEIISDLISGEWLQDAVLHDRSVDTEKLERVHSLKTASLFEWCVRAPFMALQQNDPQLHQLLQRLGRNLGVLFQRGDDLLDFDVRNEENKKILGDLQGGYLNSFAVYLVKDQIPDSVEAFFRCRSMSEIYALWGEAHFHRCVQRFDADSEQKIREFERDVAALENLLGADSATWVEQLAPLAKLLYWRQAEGA